jgi:EmrB/QacA subfamily drug resistance transporter
MSFEAATPRISVRPCEPPRSDPRWSLAVAILGSTMAFIDGTVVNVALPVMQSSLAGSVVQMQWIVEAYALLLASLVLVGGALGDRLGRRRVFVAGVALFALASAACGAAPDASLLIVARGVQGVGAALLVPGSLSLISAAYGEKKRGRAIGTWSAASAITAAIGPVLGGWLVSHASWRWLFSINVPLGLVIIVLAQWRVGETRDESAARAIDLVGATLAAIGLGVIVFALLGAPGAGGVTSTRTLVLLCVGLVTLIGFVFWEARTTHPMMPLGLFRSRTFTGTNLLTFFLYAGLGGVMFFLPFDLIQVQRYSPAMAGAALLPFVLLISLASPWAGGLVTRRGARLPLVVGPTISGLGFALLAFPGVGGSYFVTFLPGVVALGVGMGITVAPLTTAVMGAVDRSHAGVASGINNAVSRTAGLLAIAILGVVLAMRFDSVLENQLAALHVSSEVKAILHAERAKLALADLSRVPPELRGSVKHALDTAYVSGFRVCMLVCAALAVLGAFLAWVFVEGKPARPELDDDGAHS